MSFYCAFCGKLIPPRAKYVILLGHAQDTENYKFQKSIRIRGRSATKMCNFSGNEFPHDFFGKKKSNLFLRRQC